MYRSKGGSGDGHGDGGERSGPAPGKRTLTAALPARIQRKDAPGGAAEAAPAVGAAAGLIVAEAAGALQPGQMTREQFLAALHDAVTSTAGDAFGPLWSAMACPSIDNWFARNANADPSTLERMLQRYTGVQGARSAAAYLGPACERLRQGIAKQQEGGDVSAELAAVGLGSPEAAATQTLPQGDGAAAAAPTGAPAVQKKEQAGGGRDAGDRPDQVLASLGTGAALDGTTASRMGGAFGESFSDVRIHADASAGAEAGRQGALAFTVGNHVAFGAGQYNPGSPEGDALLAHELAHVVQQRGGGAGGVDQKAASGASGASHEEDADQAAEGVMRQLHGGGADVQSAAGRVGVALRSDFSLQRCSPDQKKGKDKLPKLLTDFSAAFAGTEEIIVKDKAAMKLIEEAVAAGVKYGGYAEDGPSANAWAYTVGDTVYVPRARVDKILAISDFLFELNNAVRKPKFDAIHTEGAKGSTGTLTAEQYATQKVELEVEGMLRMGEIWFGMKKDMGNGPELDQYDGEFYLAEYNAFKAGTKTKAEIVQSVLGRTYTSGANAGKTVKQYYMEQYTAISGGR